MLKSFRILTTYYYKDKFYCEDSLLLLTSENALLKWHIEV